MQVGDFYELYHDDAKKGSEILNIRLTKKTDGIPMAGVPLKAKDKYIDNLIKSNQKVVLIDQVINEKNNKDILRKVTHFYTPGTKIDIDDDNNINQINQNNIKNDNNKKFDNNYIASIWSNKWKKQFINNENNNNNTNNNNNNENDNDNKISITWTDISTGEFNIAKTDEHNIFDLLTKISPSELILPQSLIDYLFNNHNNNNNNNNLNKIFNINKKDNIIKFKLPSTLSISILNDINFGYKNNNNFIDGEINQLILNAKTNTMLMDNEILHNDYILNSIVGLLNYVQYTQLGKFPSFLKHNIINEVSNINNINEIENINNNNNKNNNINNNNKDNITTMKIDNSTILSLEILKSINGHKQSGLLHVINFSSKDFGQKELEYRLKHPLTDPILINNRLDSVEYFYKNEELKNKINLLIKNCENIQKSVNAIKLNKTKNKKQLYINIYKTIKHCRDIYNELKKDKKKLPIDINNALSQLSETIIPQINNNNRNKILNNINENNNNIEDYDDISSIYNNINNWFAQKNYQLNYLNDLEIEIEDAFNYTTDEDYENEFIISSKYNILLDKFREIAYFDNDNNTLNNITQNYIDKTGSKTLKIVRKTNLGFVIQSSLKEKNKVLKYNELKDIKDEDKLIITKELKNSVIYKTKRLNLYEQKVYNAEKMAKACEKIIIDYFDENIENFSLELLGCYEALKLLDVTIGLSTAAKELKLTRPIVDNSKILKGKNVRHLIIEVLRKPLNDVETINIENQEIVDDINFNFVGNDINIESSTSKNNTSNNNNNKESCWLLTGPNMGGKSTFLRQTALLAILAQIGSFVPADEAHVGIVDKIYSRIGASDDLVEDKSTFRVEMEETSNMLVGATDRSLLIVDEVGRGTSPEDGIAIARAVLEEIAFIGSRSLFATHFHTIAELYDNNENIKNSKDIVKYSNKIKCITAIINETNDNEFDFTYKFHPGIAKQSFGIYAAYISGMPQNVLDRAKEIRKFL